MKNSTLLSRFLELRKRDRLKEIKIANHKDPNRALNMNECTKFWGTVERYNGWVKGRDLIWLMICYQLVWRQKMLLMHIGSVRVHSNLSWKYAYFNRIYLLARWFNVVFGNRHGQPWVGCAKCLIFLNLNLRQYLYYLS